MWWLPAASSADYLILSNPLKKAVSGTLAVSSAFASHRPLAVSLAPGEDEANRLAGGAWTVRHRRSGWPQPIAAGQGIDFRHADRFRRGHRSGSDYENVDREPDDQPKSRVLRAPMMALSQPDQGLGFPNGTQLLPRIFLRNAGSAPRRYQLRLIGATRAPEHLLFQPSRYRPAR